MGLSFRGVTLVERLFATSFNTLHPILALMGQCPPYALVSISNERLDDVVLLSLHHMKGAFHLRKREPVRRQRGGIDPAVLNEPQQAGHPLPATRAQGRAYLFIAHPQTKCR